MSLYVGGLRGNPQAEDLEQMFRKVKSVSNVVSVLVKEGGNPILQDAFAFIRVEPPESATECIKVYNNCRWKNAVLKVERVLKPKFTLDSLKTPFWERRNIVRSSPQVNPLDENNPLKIRRKRGRRGTIEIVAKKSKMHLFFDETSQNMKDSVDAPRSTAFEVKPVSELDLELETISNKGIEEPVISSRSEGSDDESITDVKTASSGLGDTFRLKPDLTSNTKESSSTHVKGNSSKFVNESSSSSEDSDDEAIADVKTTSSDLVHAFRLKPDLTSSTEESLSTHLKGNSSKFVNDSPSSSEDSDDESIADVKTANSDLVDAFRLKPDLTSNTKESSSTHVKGKSSKFVNESSSSSEDSGDESIADMKTADSDLVDALRLKPDLTTTTEESPSTHAKGNTSKIVNKSSSSSEDSDDESIADVKITSSCKPIVNVSENSISRNFISNLPNNLNSEIKEDVESENDSEPNMRYPAEDQIIAPTKNELNLENSASIQILSQILGKTIELPKEEKMKETTLWGRNVVKYDPSTNDPTSDVANEIANEVSNEIANALSSEVSSEVSCDVANEIAIEIANEVSDNPMDVDESSEIPKESNVKTSLRKIFEDVHTDRSNTQFSFFDESPEIDEKEAPVEIMVSKKEDDTVELKVVAVLQEATSESNKRYSDLKFCRQESAREMWCDMRYAYTNDFKWKKQTAKKMGLGKQH